MSQCQRTSVLDETYTVVVHTPMTTRSRCWCSLLCFLLLAFLFIIFGLLWVEVYCQGPPCMDLETLSIRNMTAYQTNATGGGTQWQVDSAFDMGLSTWNLTTVARCFTTFRRVLVLGQYRGQTILLQEVPLGFSLKPRSSRPVEMTVEEENFVLKEADLGPLMQEEVRSGNVTLGMFFSARYLRNDRKAGLVGLGCAVMASSPSNPSSSSLQQILCY